MLTLDHGKLTLQLLCGCMQYGFVFWGGDFNVAKEGLDDIGHHFLLASIVPRANYGSAKRRDMFHLRTNRKPFQCKN